MSPIKRKLSAHYLGAFLFIMLFFYRKATPYPYAKEIFFMAGSLLYIHLFKSDKKDRAKTWAGSLIIISAFIQSYSLVSPAVILQLFPITIGIVLWCTIEVDQKTMARWIGFTCLIAAISPYATKSYPIVELLTKGEITLPRDYSGILAGRGHTGMYVAIAQNFLPIWAAVVTLIPLTKFAELGTVTPLAACLIGLYWRTVCLFPRKIKLCLIMLGAVGALAAAPKIVGHLKEDVRWSKWQGAIKSIQKEPTGYGPGYFPDLMVAIEREKQCPGEKCNVIAWLELHNDFLEFFFMMGIWGIPAVILTMHRALRKSWTNPQATAALGSLLICSLTWFPFHVANTGLLGMIILSIVSSKERTNAKNIFENLRNRFMSRFRFGVRRTDTL